MSVIEPARILAIHAHPDDVEFQCAGTLALLAEIGCPIVIVTMTPGDCGSAEYSAEDISRIRREEAQAAAEMIGATYLCLEFRDLAIFEDDDSRRRIVECLRRTRPEIVLTAPPSDYLRDHEVTSLLVREACFAASAPNYATRQWEPSQPLEKIPHLYYVDPVEGKDRSGETVPPDFYIDVSRMFEVKSAMLSRHESQRAWLLHQHGMDEYLKVQRDWSERRGLEIGVDHAEGFRQYRGHPFPQDNRLIELVHQDGSGSSLRAV